MRNVVFITLQGEQLEETLGDCYIAWDEMLRALFISMKGRSVPLQFLHMMEIRCWHSTFTDCSWAWRSVTGLDLKGIQSPYINEFIDGQTPLICGTVILLITSFWRRCRVPEPQFLRNRQLLLQLRQQRFQHQQECQRHAPWRCNMYDIYIYYVYSLNTHTAKAKALLIHIRSQFSRNKNEFIRCSICLAPISSHLECEALRFWLDFVVCIW